ncbi:hypothetical protein CPC08DRAFT_770857 [Agrocybe pediades]|nr:hypothetical protein CPC08DRAFT_770857 [Agrocybe pediades]
MSSSTTTLLPDSQPQAKQHPTSTNPLSSWSAAILVLCNFYCFVFDTDTDGTLASTATSTIWAAVYGQLLVQGAATAPSRTTVSSKSAVLPKTLLPVYRSNMLALFNSSNHTNKNTKRSGVKRSRLNVPIQRQLRDAPLGRGRVPSHARAELIASSCVVVFKEKGGRRGLFRCEYGYGWPRRWGGDLIYKCKPGLEWEIEFWCCSNSSITIWTPVKGSPALPPRNPTLAERLS